MGRHVISELINRGIEVHAIEHHTPLVGLPGLNIIGGSISSVDRKLIRSIKPDAIFHLARPRFPRLRIAGRVLAARWAAIQNRRLVREMEKSGHTAGLIFASGSLMYGSSAIPSDEDTPMRPFSFARQYYPGEIPILDALKSGKIPVRVIRLPWLLGKGSWFEWFYLKSMREHQAIPLFGDGNNLMEIIDIEDAARLMIIIAMSANPKGTFNLVSPGAIIQHKFAELLSSLSGFPVKDYRQLFPGGLEKEALQAFTSNIELTTKYPDLSAGSQYTSLKESLKRLLIE